MIRFESMAKVLLSSWPTPIEPLERLTEFLAGPRIFMKRDDLGSLGLGGNKLRKLEYLLGDARAQGCDVIITAGALQSNHARLTAAAAARLGLECHLILKDEVRGRSEAYQHSGNRFLDRLFGARIKVIEGEDSIPDMLEDLAKSFIEAGRKPYIIPIGGSNAVGSLGYVACMEEIARQGAFTHIFVTSGSGGTHAGLLVGALRAQVEAKVIGVAISRSAENQFVLVSDLVRQTASLLNLPPDGLPEAIHIDGNHYLPGYGIPNPGALEAISLCARLEGIVLDPVYTSKTMAALIAAIRRGDFGPDDRILFVHTGGHPALFVYEEQFDE